MRLSKLILRYFFLAGFALFASFQALAQNTPVSNLHKKIIIYTGDSIKLDSLSLIPNSLIVFKNESLLADSFYTVNHFSSRLYWKGVKLIKGDTIKIIYRTFPYSFNQVYQRKSKEIIEKEYKGYYNPYDFKRNNQGAEDLFKFEGLNKSGSISRGVSFGNKQDVIVNSSLNLQLSGKLKNDVEVNASITDENIPFQPDGYTQQLQDFDKVFIRFSKKQYSLTVGDFDIRRFDDYFLRYYKKAQGLSIAGANILSEKRPDKRLTYDASGAIARGKVARNTIQGQEGNQGPYRLQGNNNEANIIVLSGTERVYINGILQMRGQNLDYVIDYNTAEITFTPRNLITKDIRLVVEFEYSDKNYTRTLFSSHTQYDSKKASIHFDAFSEQDLANQPILQTLNDEQKLRLSLAGDKINQAYFPNIDSVGFNANEVLYKKIDTILSPVPIYKYSTNKDSAKYRLGFSFVGNNKGNYIALRSTANGKVYQWVAPVNGVPQGTHEALTLLVSPKQQQVFSAGGKIYLSKNTVLETNAALSKYDINLLSEKDKENDLGTALHTALENQRVLGKKDSLNNLKTRISYDRLDKRFKPVDQFRNIEFNRDWNLPSIADSATEHLGLASWQIENKNIGKAIFQSRSLIREQSYQGFMNSINAIGHKNNFAAQLNASMLNSRSEKTGVYSTFFRQRAELSKALRPFTIGVLNDQEINLFKKEKLQNKSYQYLEMQAYLLSNDTSKNKFALRYIQRLDQALDSNSNSLQNATLGRSISATFETPNGKAGRFLFNSTFRSLKILNQYITDKKEENSIISRAEYNLNAFKGFLFSNTFYQLITGQEMKKDYAYQEVARGKGNYIRNDYNKNGVFERDEYVLATYADTANFVKVLIPTNEYVKTYANDLSQQINLRPERILNKEMFAYPVLSRISDQFSAQLNTKTYKDSSVGSDWRYLNPFVSATKPAVVSASTTLRNTVYLNQNKAAWGAEFTSNHTSIKSLFTNGYEFRSTHEHQTIGRVALSSAFLANLMLKEGVKTNDAILFPIRNFRIVYKEMEPKLSFQPGTSFRSEVSFKLTKKINAAAQNQDAAESAVIQKIGLDTKYSAAKNGSIQVQINYFDIKYQGVANSAVGYEMLEALNPGSNLTWGLNFQKNLSNSTQISLNYDGRKSAGASAVHTGGVQVRAFF